MRNKQTSLPDRLANKPNDSATNANGTMRLIRGQHDCIDDNIALRSCLVNNRRLHIVHIVATMQQIVKFYFETAITHKLNLQNVFFVLLVKLKFVNKIHLCRCNCFFV